VETKDRDPLLRRVLAALGLSTEAIDDIVERILDWLAAKDEPAAGPTAFPYRLREDFLSAAELSFYQVLRTVVGDRTQICPKVGLGDLFFAETGDRPKNRAFTNRIDRKHVDFVLCDPKTMRPLVAVELDDRSHEREDRQQRDVFVEGVFAAAGLPLVRMPVRSAYPPWELEAKLAPYLTRVAVPPAGVSPVPNKAEEPAPASPVAAKDSAPTCPKCGGTMLLRTAKSGANAGGQFWGCANYPKCRSVVPVGG
jgi:ribosomal protein S27AE